MIQEIFDIVKDSKATFGKKFLWLTVCEMSVKMWKKQQSLPHFMQSEQAITVYLTPEMGVGDFEKARADKQKLQDVFDNSDFSKKFPKAKLVAEVLTYKNTLLWGKKNSMELN